MNKVLIGLLAAIMIFGACAGIVSPADSPPQAFAACADVDTDGDKEQLLQFTSGGHVLGFGSSEVYLAGLDHALRLEFLGGAPVQPAAEAGGAAENGAALLGTITYNNIWSNIDAVYSAVDGGIAESTYIIRPGGDPDDISLRYNVPVEIVSGGGLRFTFENGYITEDAPIAWQVVDGKKMPVEVQFQPRAENTVGFSLGGYDDSHAVYIDPTYQWHTFYGSSSDDGGNGIAADSSGNVYVTGNSQATWNGPGGQNPINN